MSIDRLNLMPKKSFKNFKFWMPEIVSVTAAIGFLFVVTTNLAIQLTNSYWAEKLYKAKDQNFELGLQVKEANILSAKTQARKDKIGVIRGLIGDRIAWSDILKELSLVVPNDVWLTEFHSVKDEEDKNSKVVLIKGEGKSQTQIMKFFKSLKNSEHFRASEFRFSERVPASDPHIYSFFIEVWLEDIQ